MNKRRHRRKINTVHARWFKGWQRYMQSVGRLTTRQERLKRPNWQHYKSVYTEGSALELVRKMRAAYSTHEFTSPNIRM